MGVCRNRMICVMCAPRYILPRSYRVDEIAHYVGIPFLKLNHQDHANSYARFFHCLHIGFQSSFVGLSVWLFGWLFVCFVLFCFCQKFSTGPLEQTENQSILSFRGQGVCSKGPVQNFLLYGFVLFRFVSFCLFVCLFVRLFVLFSFVLFPFVLFRLVSFCFVSLCFVFVCLLIWVWFGLVRFGLVRFGWLVGWFVGLSVC